MCAEGEGQKLALTWRSQECEISVIDRNRRIALGAAALCEGVLVGDVEHLTPVEEFGKGSFDCIVAIGLLESVQNPQTVLVGLKECLQAEGFLIATWTPNEQMGRVTMSAWGQGARAGPRVNPKPTLYPMGKHIQVKCQIVFPYLPSHV